MKYLKITFTTAALAICFGCNKQSNYSCTCYDHFDNIVFSDGYESKNMEEAQNKCSQNYEFTQHSSCNTRLE